MDFQKAGCRIEFLRKDELTHELLIRKISAKPDTTVETLRKLLHQSSLLVHRGGMLISADSEGVDIISELGVLSQKIDELEKDLEGEPLSVVTRSRLTARCKYFLIRISRLKVRSPEVDTLNSRLVVLMSQLGSESSSPSETSDDDTGVAPKAATVIYKTKAKYNLNLLNVKFQGNTCIREFATRLEELRIAHRIPKRIIYDGFPVLLEGAALAWYRYHKTKYFSYDEVLEALRLHFDLPDLDFRLLNEIRSRTQGKEESVISYVSLMLGMFDRLAKPKADDEKFDIIRRNLRPDFSLHIAMARVANIEQLLEVTMRLETARVESQSFKEPSPTSPTLVQDFCDKSKPKGKTLSYYNSRHGNVSSVRAKPNRGSGDQSSQVLKTGSLCFRCGGGNHDTKNCKRSKEIVCYRCGNKGTRASDCPKCSAVKKDKFPKNG